MRSYAKFISGCAYIRAKKEGGGKDLFERRDQIWNDHMDWLMNQNKQLHTEAEVARSVAGFLLDEAIAERKALKKICKTRKEKK